MKKYVLPLTILFCSLHLQANDIIIDSSKKVPIELFIYHDCSTEAFDAVDEYHETGGSDDFVAGLIFEIQIGICQYQHDFYGYDYPYKRI